MVANNANILWLPELGPHDMDFGRTGALGRATLSGRGEPVAYESFSRLTEGSALYLKRIEMVGFKSFADKPRLEIRARA